MDAILDSIITRGDLAHLALFCWAAMASLLLYITLREVFRLHRRFDTFVRELSRFNDRINRGGGVSQE